MFNLIGLCEKGLVPDFVARAGMRRLIARRLAAELAGTEQELVDRYEQTLEDLKECPVALSPDIANQQHYEVPAAFFEQVLGPRMKYSACLWPDDGTTLTTAEDNMLELTCVRAQIQDGDEVLDLGCGWGSLTIWIAERYPNNTITAVTNSKVQQQHVLVTAGERGLQNVDVIVADMNNFQSNKQFDRVVSIEMFEHMRNYAELMRRIAGWLKPGGTLFVHIFCHDKVMYPFDIKGHTDWMARYYFTDGLMPAFRTLVEFQDDLEHERSWQISGTHYQRTLNAWLERQDRAKPIILPLFASAYGVDSARLWFRRWRMFFMSCAELFGYHDGDEWYVAHYRFRKPD